jgi:hypothetical protein
MINAQNVDNPLLKVNIETWDVGMFAKNVAKNLKIPSMTSFVETVINVESLENIQQLLTDLGFSVEIPGLVIGQKSGMQHHFSLIAKKLVDGQERVIALDHAVSEIEVATSPLILYLYKTSEVNVDVPIFVAIPQLNETAKKITQGHDILLIEGSIAEPEVMARIKSEIERRLEAKKPAATSVTDQGEEDKTQKKSFLSKFMGVKKKKVTP